jgi:membrane protease YdiL (CAAX protease family)
MALSEVIREVSETSMRLTFGLMSMLFCFWAWILVNVPTLFNLAVIYLFLISGASFIGGVAFASNFAYPFATLGFPTLKELPETTFVGALIGAAWIYISAALNILVPPMQTSIYRELPFTVALILAVATSLTEEILVRATILPTTIRIFKSKTAGTLFTSIFFSALVSAFLFSITVSILVLHYRTGWVAGAAHTTYNLTILYFTLQP